MSVVTNGVARIQHADTAEIYEIEADELDWQQVAADERQMGLEIGYLAQLEHPELGTLEWELWEYPVGVENDQSVDVGRHRLLQNFTISLGRGSPDDPEDEDEEEDDEEEEVNPEEFRAKVDELVEWFHERYEDPAERTPFESAEGGYQWIWGGPHDAREVLGDAFPDDEAAVEAAVKEIESDGLFEWAPKSGYEDEGSDGEDERDGDPADNVGAEAEDSDGSLAFALRLALLEIPRPQPGPRFETDVAGRIELTGWQEDEGPLEPEPLSLGAEIREASEELVAALEGTNAHPELLAEASRYLAAVTTEGLTIGQFYGRGIRLENADFALAADIEDGSRPPLPSGAKAALQSVLHLHAAAVMNNVEGARLVAAADAYRRPSGATADAQSAARRLSEGVQQATDLIGPAARTAVAEAASTVGAGLHPERSNQVSAGILGGVLRSVSAVLKFADSGMMGRFVWEAVKGTVVMAGVVQGATGGLNLAFQFLLEQAPNLEILAALLIPELHWLRPLATVLMRIRERARRGAPEA